MTIKQVFVFKIHEPPGERIKALPFKKIRFLFEKAENGFFVSKLFYHTGQIGIENVLRRVVIETAVKVFDFFTDKGVVGLEKSRKR